ncbi:hypothetical protein LSH36_664g01040 [Paralvinella palmiformis]|uniref:Glycosyltransferase family 92 protein n=1 Tax=Paralvinella palmiformis TaxID=53620 RepID=A0AAD9J310_9ANNE|nr:hypothetical protein LSH36_664g01040 [Paralvinella palmiformis]
MRCMLASRWRRLALYVLFQKRLIFSLLFLNLVFFIGMYFMASSDDAFGKAAPDVFNPEVDVLDIDPINDHSRYADKDPNGVIDHYQKNCSQLKRPHPNLTEAFRWHKVASKTFVYSAYFDNRTSMDFVLIWGISAGSAGVKGERSKRYCQVWYHNRILPVILWAVYEIIPETHGLRYAPAMFICPVIRHDPPYAVSLVTSKCARPSHVLPVHGPSHLKPRATFTVCVSPLNKHYDDIHSLVEFIEMNLILGADKIVFYNHTTGPHLDRYLSHYVSIGVVDVIPWKIPVAVDPDPPDPRIAPEIHYFGQVVALNEVPISVHVQLQVLGVH